MDAAAEPTWTYLRRLLRVNTSMLPSSGNGMNLGSLFSFSVIENRFVVYETFNPSKRFAY